MASPPPVIPVTANCGSHMRDPYGAGPPVSARHHANTERGCTGLLRSYNLAVPRQAVFESAHQLGATANLSC